jgi:hypothetical protein
LVRRFVMGFKVIRDLLMDFKRIGGDGSVRILEKRVIQCMPLLVTKLE